MDIQEIKTLTDLMIENDLAEIMIRDGEKRIIIRRGIAAQHAHQTHVPGAPVVSHSPAPGPATVPAALQASVAPASDPTMATIKSPMVGTFYVASSPDAPPFIKLGDRVNPETVVCIIEAMKVFNEIKSEVAGVIESIEIAGGSPVEYGQVLMKVRTA